MKKLSIPIRRIAALAVALLLVLSVGYPVRASSTDSTEATSETATESAAELSTYPDTDYAYIRKWDDYIKAYQPAYGDTWMFHDIRDAIVKVLEAGKTAIQAGDYDAARQAGSDGYYGYYDLAFENATNMYISGSRVKQLELLFGQLRTLGADGNVDEYLTTCDTIEQYVNEDADKLDGQDLDSSSSTEESTDTAGSSSETSSDSTSTSGTPSTANQRSATMLVFLGTFFDILREGIEAMIVVAGIIAYLRVQVRNGTAKKSKTLYPVYFGALFGIVCSFIMAWILNIVRTMTGSSSHQQEMVEGFTGLLAVCVLFWTCNWMLSKSETEAWTAYIKDKTKAGASGGNVFGLAFASFLAVFREGAEAVLFLQPYMRNSEQSAGVVWGVIVAGLCLVVIYILINFLSVKLPMRIFFNATSILMAFMAVCFLGSGLSGLIEAEVIGAYSAPWVAWIPMNNAVLDTLGIYPYVNTIVPQIILAVILIIMFHFGFKRNKQIREVANARKTVEDLKKAAADRKASDAQFRANVERVIYETLQKEGQVKTLPDSVIATQKAEKDTEAAEAKAIADAEAKYQKLEAEEEARNKKKEEKKAKKKK